MRADHYDSFAQSYARDNESGLFNAHYERPAMIELAGDVHGRRVLDAGCGSGALSEALRARGVIVAGFDSSPAMLELARPQLHSSMESAAPTGDRFDLPHRLGSSQRTAAGTAFPARPESRTISGAVRKGFGYRRARPTRHIRTSS